MAPELVHNALDQGLLHVLQRLHVVALHAVAGDHLHGVREVEARASDEPL